MGKSTFFIHEAKEEQGIQNLEKSLLDLKGIERALVDPDDGEIKIEYDEKRLELTEIVNYIENKGFHIKQ